jgi:hypothetical protein
MDGSTSAPPSRRRPRSARLVISAAVLAVASTVALVALLTGSPEVLAVVAVTGVGSGWLTLRLACTELRLLRRHAARDRAWQAAEFRDHVSRTCGEHSAFATAMTQRLAAREREVRELEGTLRLSEARACAAEDRVRREARRVDDARSRIVELEVALAIRRAEEADELATWEPGGPEVDTVVDLLAWEDRARSSGAASDAGRLRRGA